MFINKLKPLRERHQVSALFMARKLEIDEETYVSLENINKPVPKQYLPRLAKMLGAEESDINVVVDEGKDEGELSGAARAYSKLSKKDKRQLLKLAALKKALSSKVG